MIGNRCAEIDEENELLRDQLLEQDVEIGELKATINELRAQLDARCASCPS